MKWPYPPKRLAYELLYSDRAWGRLVLSPWRSSLGARLKHRGALEAGGPKAEVEYVYLGFGLWWRMK